jgi:parallel beta-helix repeat protein
MKIKTLLAASLLLFFLPAGASATCGDSITEDTTLEEGVSHCREEGLEIASDNVTLDCRGHSITGLNDRHPGILAEGVENISIEACDVSGFYDGISLKNVTDSTVLNSSASFNYASGISLESSDSNTISGNDVDRNWDGIFLQNSTENAVVDNSVHRNDIDGVHLFYGSTDNLVKDNDLRENLGHGIAPAVCDNSIEGNIAGNGKHVKYVENARGIEIRDKSRYSEIILCNVTDSVIKNVTINNSKINTDGVLLVNSDSNKVVNSTFNNVRTGIYLFHSSNNNRLTANTVTSSDLGIRLRKNSTDNKVIRNTVKNTEVYLKAVKDSENNLFLNNSLEGSTASFSNNGSIEIESPLDGILENRNITEPPEKTLKEAPEPYLLLSIVSFLIFTGFVAYNVLEA